MLHTCSHRCKLDNFFCKNQILSSNKWTAQRSAHRMPFASLKIIFWLLKQNTFLLPKPSFFYSHPPRALWKSHDIINIIIILYWFFNHATLDISAFFITHTHIIFIIIFFNHATSGVSVMGHFSKRKSHINDLP